MTSTPVALLCCLLIALFVLSAYVYWAKMTGRSLPHWRNSLGLVSMLTLFLDWLVHTVAWTFSSFGVRPSMMGTIWFDLMIYFLPVGMVSAIFLRSYPRLLVVAAWLLMPLFVGHFYIA